MSHQFALAQLAVGRCRLQTDIAHGVVSQRIALDVKAKHCLLDGGHSRAAWILLFGSSIFVLKESE
jgi:hypothetical protein